MAKKRSSIVKRLDYYCRSKRFWQWFVFAVFFGVYIFSAPQFASGIRNSDEFINQGFNLGVPRSPGYPLFTLMIFVVSHIPVDGFAAAFRAHWLSVGLSAASVALIFMASWDIYDQLTLRKKFSFVLLNKSFERWYLAMVTATGLGFSNLFWRQAVVVEKEVLSIFFFSLLLWILVKMGSKFGSKKENWLKLGFLLGLAVSHSYLFLFVVPTVGFLHWKRLKPGRDNIVQLILSVIIGIVAPYLILFIAAQRKVAFSWVFALDFGSVAAWVWQGYLGDGVVLQNSISGIFDNLKIRTVLISIWNGLTTSVDSFGYHSLLLSLLVWGYWSVRRGKMIAWILTMFAGMALGVGIILGWSEQNEVRSSIVAAFSVYNVALGLLLWFGWFEYVKRIGPALAILLRKKIVYGVMVLVPVLFVVASALLNAGRSPLSGFTYSQDVYAHVLDELEESSIISCFSVTSCNGLILQQQTNGLRRDVTIVPFYYLNENILLTEDGLQKFSYRTFPFVMFDIITSNLHNRSVYVIDLFDRYFNFFGIDDGFVNYIPKGHYGQLKHGIPEEFVAVVYPISESLIDDMQNYYGSDVLAFSRAITQQHVLNATVYMKMGLRQFGYEEMNLASNFYQFFPRDTRVEFGLFREQVERFTQTDFYKPGAVAVTPEFVLDQVDILNEQGLFGLSEKIARGAVTIDPYNAEARLVWGGLLEQNNATPEAVMEYINALQLDSENEIALSRLRELGVISKN